VNKNTKKILVVGIFLLGGIYGIKKILPFLRGSSDFVGQEIEDVIIDERPDNKGSGGAPPVYVAPPTQEFFDLSVYEPDRNRQGEVTVGGGKLNC